MNPTLSILVAAIGGVLIGDVLAQYRLRRSVRRAVLAAAQGDTTELHELAGLR